jgi:hypothetical protein
LNLLEGKEFFAPPGNFTKIEKKISLVGHEQWFRKINQREEEVVSPIGGQIVKIFDNLSLQLVSLKGTQFIIIPEIEREGAGVFLKTVEVKVKIGDKVNQKQILFKFNDSKRFKGVGIIFPWQENIKKLFFLKRKLKQRFFLKITVKNNSTFLKFFLKLFKFNKKIKNKIDL